MICLHPGKRLCNTMHATQGLLGVCIHIKPFDAGFLALSQTNSGQTVLLKQATPLVKTLLYQACMLNMLPGFG